VREAAAAGVVMVALRCRMEVDAPGGTARVVFLGPAPVDLDYGLSAATPIVGKQAGKGRAKRVSGAPQMAKGKRGA
jgi:hypothetical protein